MFIRKKKYAKLASDVDLLDSAIFGGAFRSLGLLTEIRDKVNYKELDLLEGKLQSRIDELTGLLIKAGILVEVQEPKADFTRKESELNSHNQRIGSKQVRYAVKKIK